MPKKRSAKTNDLRSILSGNDMDCSDSSQEQSKTKPKAKMREGRDSRKHKKKDVSIVLGF